MFTLNYSQKTNEIVDWIHKTVQDAGFQKAVVAVSGGVDSATSLFLTVKALGKENVSAILLPYGKLSKESLEHGQLVVKAAGIPKEQVYVRDIEKGVTVILNESEGSQTNKTLTTVLSQKGEEDQGEVIRKGNIMARVRMIYTFDLAKAINALVVGTENKSEHYLGYFTRFGDEASDIEPIRSLYKTHVWEMATYLGVPKEIIEKAPSAGLWDNQSDEGEFGFSYKDADTVLYMHFEEEKRNGDIVAAGIDETTVKHVLSFVAKNDFKHKVPYVFEA